MFKGKPTGQTSLEKRKKVPAGNDLREKLNELVAEQKVFGDQGIDPLEAAKIADHSNKILLAILQTQIETFELLRKIREENDQ